MEPIRFDYGDEVRVTRNLRNDGTFPGEATGALLVRRGAVGVVRDVGTFLQDQIIYTVHFLDADRLVGCRDRELIGAREPWLESRFEFGDKVKAAIPLGIRGEVVAAPGDIGEILKVLRDEATVSALGGVGYHVRFPGRTLQVPEAALAPAEDAPAASPDGEEAA
jgi:nitrogen fixation protein NifZ